MSLGDCPRCWEHNCENEEQKRQLDRNEDIIMSQFMRLEALRRVAEAARGITKNGTDLRAWDELHAALDALEEHGTEE